MREGYYVTRTYAAGKVGEKIKFFVPGRKPDRTTRRAKSEVKKQEQNAYSTEKRLARLLNANFGPGDLLMGLDYSKAGFKRLLAAAALPADISEEEGAARIRKAAERELRLVLRRVKRELEKEGISLRYVAITSDMDGSTGETVRIHHHLVVPAAAKEAFKKKWAVLGGVDWSPLEDQDDYTAIAEYFIRQVRHVPDEKKYIPSRNLIRPQPKDRIAAGGAELRVPRDGKLLYRSEFRPGQPQYIRYVLPEAKRTRACAGAGRRGEERT